MAFAIDGKIGVKFSDRLAGTTTDGAGAVFPLGTVVTGSDGDTYMYVQANGAITAYDTVWVIPSTYQAASITPALAVTGGRPGFAQAAFADNDFGWVVIHGNNLRIRFADACAKDVPLYTTDTAGVLDDATVSLSQHQVMGVVIATVAGNSVSNALASAAFPLIRRPAA